MYLIFELKESQKVYKGTLESCK